MANHIYATSEFSDINEVDWKITIRKMTSAADNATTFYVGGDGFVITYENDNEYDVLTPIMGSTCEFTMMYEEGDRSRFENMYSDILSGEDGLFCVEVHRDQDGDNDLWWRGYILPEAIVVEDTAPYERVTIRAVDGLGALGSVDYTGTATELYRVINDCLLQLPYTEFYPPLTGYPWFGVVDDFIASNGFNYSTDYSLSLLTLQYNYVREDTWLNVDNDGVAQYYSVKDVLESICKTYNMRLYQWQGVFYFVPLGALQDTTNIRAVIYNSAPLFLSYDDIEHNAQFGLSQNFRKMRGWVQTALPPHGEIKITRDYQGDKAVLSRSNLDLSTTIVDESADYLEDDRLRVSCNFLYRFTGIPTGNTDNNRYGRILIKVKLQIGNNASAANNYYINRPYSIGTSSFIHASGDQYDNDFANTLELGADAYSEIEWTSTDTDRYNVILPFIIDRENGTGQTLQDGYYLNKQLTFVTPPIPADKTKLWLTVEAVGIQADGTTNSDYLDTTYADYQLRNVKVQYSTGTQEQEFGTVDITAKADGRYDVDLGSTLIGDRIASENYGIIKTLTISTSKEEATDWRSRQSTTAGLSINKLAVNERMGFYKNGKVIQRGTLLQTSGQLYLTPHTIIRDSDNSYDYFVTTLRHVAGSGQWDVTLVRDGRAISGITLAQDNSKPSKDVTQNDPGNVSTPNDMKGEALITNVVYNYNKRARQNFTSSWSGVIGTETKEMYWTITNDGQGKYFDHQGETPAVGKQIERTVYVQWRGLQTPSDSGWQTPSAVQPSADDSLADCIALMQDYMSKVGDHGSYTFVVSYKETDLFSGILDTYTTASAAYSTRRLTASYTGSLLRVRRADGTEQDIGYDDDGHLDESAISTFAGGTACTVSRWYDQSGNGNHVTNTTVSAQPQIYTGSVFYSIGAGTPTRKALLFNSDYLQATADLHAGAFYAASAVVTGSTIGNLHILNQDDSLAGGAARIGQYLRTGSNNNGTARCVVFNTSGTSTADNTAPSTVAANTAYVISSHGKSTQVEAFVDDVSDGHTSLTGPLRHGSGLYRVGATAHTTTPASFWNGRIAEIIFFDEDMSGGHQTGVVTDIQTYFTI